MMILIKKRLSRIYQGILNFIRSIYHVFLPSDSVDTNPILLCSLEQYTPCLRLLYNAGCRIYLPKEDEADTHIKEALKLKKKFSNKKSSDRIEERLRIQAYANPDYIATG